MQQLSHQQGITESGFGQNNNVVDSLARQVNCRRELRMVEFLAGAPHSPSAINSSNSKSKGNIMDKWIVVQFGALMLRFHAWQD